MVHAKPAKKTGTIEVRLSDAAKAAFMDRCRDEGQTASEAIRGFIDARIAPPPRRAPSWRMAVAGAIGILIGAGVAAPSLARAAHPTQAAFDQLDRNHDGLLSYEEYRAR